jgi:hypothetical protein
MVIKKGVADMVADVCLVADITGKRQVFLHIR